MPHQEAGKLEDGSDVVALARKVGLVGFGGLADAEQSAPAASQSSGNRDEDGSDIVALARKVGIAGFGRFAANKTAPARSES